MTANWPEARLREEATKQAEFFVDRLRAVQGQIPQLAVSFGVSQAEVDGFIRDINSDVWAAQFKADLSPTLIMAMKAGKKLARYFTQDAVPAPVDVYDDPDALAEILRNTFPAFRDKICAAG